MKSRDTLILGAALLLSAGAVVVMAMLLRHASQTAARAQTMMGYQPEAAKHAMASQAAR